jgi:Rps23 Pro-64 3,4-dihydroxylase Tpa1-like proline 4-hydroxylase
MPPYRLIRNFLPSPLDQSLIDWAIENEVSFAPTIVVNQGRDNVDPELRQSVGVGKFGSAKETIRARAREVAPGLISAFGVNPSEVDFVEVELVAHNDGAFFKRHKDTVSGEGWGTDGMRTVSLICYLFREPKAFTGGALRLFAWAADGSADASVDIEPEHNTLVAFPSWAAHEVLPIACPSGAFADSRFAINIWLHAPAPEGAA